MKDKPMALFLSTEPPYPMVGGGALRAGSILEYLLSRYQVDAICFREPGGASERPPLSETAGAAGLRRWSEVPLPYHGKSFLSRGWRNLGRAVRSVPPLVDRFSGFEPQVLEAMEGARYDVAVVEHFWCVRYGVLLRPHCEKLVLDLHNAESLWQTRSADAAPRWIQPVHRRFVRAAVRLERELLPQYDLILTTSQAESDYIATALPNLPLAVVPNTLRMQPRPVTARDDSIVFSGNMEYLPNQKAAVYFARDIWPLLLRRFPRLRWKILGKSAGILRLSLRDTPGTLFVSDPDDAMIEIAKASVAVVPLTAGAGTRLKILEAWAAGCPVVSTSIGAEGLEYSEGVDILIENSPAAFAEAAARVIEDPQLAAGLADAGRVRFERSYSWASAWDALQASGL